MNSKKTKTAWTVCGVALLALAAQLASADPFHHDDRRVHPGGRPAVAHYDARFARAHFYPARGFVVHALPVGYRRFYWHGVPYFFAGGVWYAASGGAFVVVGAPIGLFVPVLPPYYTQIWVGGVPYYYANDAYYEWDPAQQGYEVVAPPPGAPPPEEEGTDAPPEGMPPPAAAAGPGAPPAAAGDVFIYPRNGQSEAQQATDKYECHRWAVSQSGFDPTVAGGGVPPDQNAIARSSYLRAQKACLEGRGYSVQ